MPTSGHRGTIERLLDGLARQTLAIDRFEVVVVLNPADDATVELVDRFSGRLPLVRIVQPRRGRAAACNAGIARAAGALILLLDDDMEPTPSCLAAHLAAHARAGRAAVAGAVPVVAGRPPRPLELWVSRRFDDHHRRVAEPGRPFHLRDFYTGNTSIPRDVLQEVGGFDEEFSHYGHEDLELLVRLRRAHVEVLFEPRAEARQTYAKSFEEFARDRRDAGHTAVQLARMHPEVAPELVEFRGVSRAWTPVKALLLRGSRIGLPVPQAVTALARVVERRLPHRSTLFYWLAEDFFFWLGVQDAGPVARVVFGPPPR